MKKIGRYPPPCIAVSNFEKEILTKNVQICSYISITLYYYHYILQFMQTINKNMKIFFSFGIKHEPNEIKSSHNIQKKNQYSQLMRNDFLCAFLMRKLFFEIPLTNY